MFVLKGIVRLGVYVVYGINILYCIVHIKICNFICLSVYHVNGVV